MRWPGFVTGMQGLLLTSSRPSSLLQTSIVRRIGVDAVGGARIQAMLSPKLVLTIEGDAGGGGANSDYQVGGLIGWKLKKIILQAGYR
jgi:hypothetical protein